jgi:LmbE family N-acetylglucosaminyl deacetylase
MVFENNEENKMKLIVAIRKYQPGIVIGNVLHDRHPDHGRAGNLIAEACFLAGFQKFNPTMNKVPGRNAGVLLALYQDYYR